MGKLHSTENGMRYLAYLVLLVLIGCTQQATLEDPQPMALGPTGATRVPVSGRGGGAVRPTGGNQRAVRAPVAGGGQVVGGGVIWEYDTLSQVRLTGILRGQPEEAIEQALRDALNEWGALGWELVMVSGHTYIFKRPAAGF